MKINIDWERLNTTVAFISLGLTVIGAITAPKAREQMIKDEIDARYRQDKAERYDDEES